MKCSEQTNPYRLKTDDWFSRAGGHKGCGVSFWGNENDLKSIVMKEAQLNIQKPLNCTVQMGE